MHPFLVVAPSAAAPLDLFGQLLAAGGAHLLDSTTAGAPVDAAAQGMSNAEEWLTKLTAQGADDFAFSLGADLCADLCARPAFSNPLTESYTVNDESECDRPANTPNSRRKHAGGRVKGAQLTKEQVLKWQHLSLKDAAKACCMGTTQFKLQCRELGIGRWPHRKLASLAVLERNLAEHRERLRADTGAVPAALIEWENRLHEVKAYVHAHPDTTATPGAEGQRMLAELETIRQWDVKFHYNRKKKLAAGGAAVLTSGATPASPPPALKTEDTAAARMTARLCGCLRPARAAAAGRPRKGAQ